MLLEFVRCVEQYLYYCSCGWAYAVLAAGDVVVTLGCINDKENYYKSEM